MDVIVDFIVGTQVSGIPSEVMRHTTSLIADAIACGVAGSTTATSAKARAAMSSDGSTGSHTVWGASEGFSLSDAVLLDATSVDALDADDATANALIHIGPVAVVPALHCSARANYGDTPDWSGPHVVGAIALGCEVAATVGRTVGVPMLEQGFHPAPISGVFGATATLSRLLGLDAEQTAQALGIAASLGAGLMGAQHGAMVKALHMGRAAQAGLMAVVGAREGMTGVPHLLSGDYGTFTGAYAGAGRTILDVDRLGKQWYTTDIEVKLSPCGASTYAPVDAIVILAERGAIGSAADIVEVNVAVPTVTYQHGGWAFTPEEGAGGARMNIGWCVASQLRRGAVDLQSFTPTALQDEVTLAIARKVIVRPEPKLDGGGIAGRHAVDVEVVTRTGKDSISLKRGHGSAAYPVEDSRLVNKADEFLSLAGAARDGARLVMEARALMAGGDACEFARRWLSFA
ncbi:MAG: MmgE/PrpD family protein [Candidatus Dormibacteria bacterium]